MSQTNSKPSPLSNLGRALIAAAGLAVMSQSVLAAGTWAPVAIAPAPINLMLLLHDGTVMGFNTITLPSTIGRNVYKLTPNSVGSYAAGTWTALAPMIDTRLYIQSFVLPNGKVFVSGGEYGTGQGKAELYDPVANTWTQLTPPIAVFNPAAASPVGGTQRFYDCNAEIITNGNILLMPVFPRTAGMCIQYNPTTNVWTSGPSLVRGVYMDEATWIKLPDDTILTLDPFGTNTLASNFSERYNPATNTWINDAISPVNIYDAFGFEVGGGAMLPNGKAIIFGGNGNNVLYTPSGSVAPGTWAAAPTVAGKGQPDAPVSMMPNGKVLLAMSPLPTAANHFPAPVTFYEYDYVTNTFAATGNAPVGVSDNISAYQALMLNLPDGKIMYSHMATSTYVYTPDGTVLAAAKPTVSTVTLNSGTSYHLTGIHLNGISEGAIYGDDWQMNTNYPIVRITNTVGGAVYYCRSTNWNANGIGNNGSTATDFALHPSAPAGVYNLQVIANGVPSDNFPFSFGVGPGNDSCGNATNVSAGGTFAGTLVGATNDGTGSCGLSAGQPDVWYTFTNGNCQTRLSVDTFGSQAVNNIDTVLTLFTTCNGTEIACNDDASGHDSLVSTMLNPGQTVKIRVSRFNTTALLPFILHVTATNNDHCADAFPIAVGSTSWSNNCFTADTDGPTEANCSFCCGDLQVNGDVWYNFVAPTSSTFVIDTIGSNFDTKLAAYADACPSAANTAVACNDDGGGSLGTLSRMKLTTTAGHNYKIRAGGYTTARGGGTINIFCSADFNRDGVVDFFDYLDFVDAFSANAAEADFNGDSAIDFFDYLDFVDAFSAGC